MVRLGGKQTNRLKEFFGASHSAVRIEPISMDLTLAAKDTGLGQPNRDGFISAQVAREKLLSARPS